MHYNDLINGGFELFGGVLLILNVRRILIDKAVAGVSWMPVFFFTSWGVWNLYYYPSLNQWFSFAGGCLIVVVNALWLALVFKYRRRFIPANSEVENGPIR